MHVQQRPQSGLGSAAALVSPARPSDEPTVTGGRSLPVLLDYCYLTIFESFSANFLARRRWRGAHRLVRGPRPS